MSEQDQVMKHTAGESLPPSPWYVDPDDRPNMEWNNHILSADGNTVCFMAHNPNDNTKLENAARLIASTPELLEALKKLSFAAQTSGGTAGRDEYLVEAIEVATQAIAVAEGRSA